MHHKAHNIVQFAIRATSGLITGALVSACLLLVPYIILASPVVDYSVADLEPAAQRTLVLHDSEGQPFARRGGCVAQPVSLSEVPQHFIDALLSMEDRRFYDHVGIDPIGLARAAIENRAAGRIVQGGSTITQQLVKYSLLSSDRTMERKRKEAWLALSLELRFKKDEILERYLSSAYFGEGCYGLRAAAKQYFQAPVSELTLPQSAYLVALLRSPTVLARDADAAATRAEVVLDAMVSNGKLYPAVRAGLQVSWLRASSRKPTGSYYADWVAGTLQVPRSTQYEPLPVHTTFDPDLQHMAEDAIEAVMAKQGESLNANQAAMVVMQTDGRVLAMVGGRNYSQSQFNRAVQARRQPGSSFKLFVYLAALRAGLKPNSRVVDRPISIANYEPKNFSSRHRGAIPVRDAFASSINTVAVQLSEAVGRKPVIRAARDLGITTPLELHPSLALGSFEVSLLELTSAYAAVAAGAYPVRPWAITGFEDPEVYSAPPRAAGKWRLQEQEHMLTLLRATVERGTGRRARLPIRAYGKTGTSSDYRDAWFIGFTGDLVVGVWVGNDDFSSMKRVTGGNLPAEMWATFMGDAIKADDRFPKELPQIAAFPADVREGQPEVELVSGVIVPKAKSGPVSKRKARAQPRVERRPDLRKRPIIGGERGLFRGLFR